MKSEPVEFLARPIPLSLVFMAAVLVHLPLLLMKLPLKSYDTNFHIFFASHYVHHWFDPWNAKWYAGFTQTTYPPLPQQWVALISRITGLDMAYMAVQLAAILLLVVGVYRFSLLWVSPRAASIAALASVFLGSESFLVYSAGQLATTCAAPIYLNALPFLFDWVRRANRRAFAEGMLCFSLRQLPAITLPFCSAPCYLHCRFSRSCFLIAAMASASTAQAFIGRTVTIALVGGSGDRDCIASVLDRVDP